MRFYYIFFLIFICVFNIKNTYSQCLNSETNNSNTGGYFDNTNWDSSYWWTTNTEGTITRDTSDFYHGSGISTPGSLKAVVSFSDDYTNDKVRLWTRAGNCGFAVSSGQSWNVSFYIKGEVGNVIEFKLIDDANSYTESIGDASYTVAYNGWHYMRLNITSSGSASSNDGRLRINFKSPGTYRLDNVVLEQETAFNNWYVDDVVNNGSGSLASPFNSIKNATINNLSYRSGDLIHVKSGTYQNNGYDGAVDGSYSSINSPGNDDNNAYLNIGGTTRYDSNLDGNTNGSDNYWLDDHGSINRPIIIRNYIDSNGNHDNPKIQFDGKGGFVIGSNDKPVKHLEIAGFQIQGPNDILNYTMAKLNRDYAVSDRALNNSTDTDRQMYHGRGITIWGGYYVNIHNNEVWDCPNSGIRVNNGDYIWLTYNTVFDNTWWSYNAESGIVIAQSKNRDGITNNANTIKMRIENNVAYGNINKLPYFNPNYACQTNGSYDTNNTGYACGGQNKIIDGSGVYITRNAWDADDSSGSNPNYASGESLYDASGTGYVGSFLFANNVSYANGMNGVVVHKTNNSNVYNNTVYKNGEVPSDDDADWGSYGVDWKDALTVSRQKYTGIVVHSSTDVKVYNNISCAKNSSDKSFVLYTENGWPASTADWGNNLPCNGTSVSSSNISNESWLTQADPLFNDPTNNSLDNRDYTLNVGSPAIDAGNDLYATANDINNISRPQGSSSDLGAYEHQNTWTGSSGTDWSTTNNWSTNFIPISGRSPIIPDVTNQPIISGDDGSNGVVTLKAITIKSGAELTLNKDASLTISGNLTNNNGTLTLNSDSNEFSSLIVQGTSSGNITYNRYVNSLSGGTGWDLIGSPVNGLQISSFVSTNDAGSSPLATGNGSGQGASGEYAIGIYDPSNNSWSNYTSSNVSTTQFTPGKGYQMATDSGATLAFTGTVDTDATETISIESFTDASGSHWNLISNPYPSFITIGPNTTTDTFLEVNDDVIHATYVGVYGYDADNSNGSNYTIYNNTSSSKIAPGQGFFVAARSTDAANITFKEAMQTTSTGDDFISGDVMENTEVELRIYNNGNTVGNTKLFFDEGLTLGLNPGWDAGSYSQSASIMTRLVQEDEGHGMAINAMGLDAMENAVIPLVINQAAGQEFRINLHTATIPDPNVYLEDVEEGTFTNLYEGDFVYTPTIDLEGVGRFFIHMTADSMSNGEVSTSMLNAYKEIDASYITIEGLATQTNQTKVSLYNILGREVLSTTLNNNMGTQTISTLGLSAGIYVIELESGSDRLTKKLLIQ